MSVEAVYPKVRHIISDVLMVDEEEVSIESRLIGDLGAESIDFLDLVFQLEREFKIKIPRGQLEKDARGSLSDDEFEKGGVVTDQGLSALKQYFSETADEHFKANLKVNEIPTLFTVQTFCKLVTKQQQAGDVEQGTNSEAVA